MANDIVTTNLVTFLFGEADKEAHLSYYASAYKRTETNQPSQNLFISWIN